MKETSLPPISATEMKSYMKHAQSWESDRQMRLAKSERRAWWVAGIACLFSLATIAALIAHETRPITAPPIIAIDKTSGNVEIIKAGDDISKNYSELLEKYWTKRYVVARETYQYTTLQYDYDITLALSSDGVGTSYAKEFEGENAKDKKLGAQTEDRIKVISVVLPPDQKRTAVIRFEKVRRHIGSHDQEDTTRRIFVATLSYKFEPSMRGREKDLIENPLGFKVTAYRVDAEIN